MRVLRVLSSAAVALAAAVGGLYYAYDSRFYPVPPEPDYPAPANLAEAQAQDIDCARHVFTLDRSWSPAALSDAKARMDELAGRAGSMTPLQFDFAIAEIVALADNGHTRVHAGGRSHASNRVPLRLFPFADGLRVVRAAGAHADLLGARLAKVDGVPVGDIIARSRGLYGGPVHGRDAMAYLLLESPQQLNALGYAARPETARYAFVLADGREVEREVAGDLPDDKRVRAYVERWLSPDPVPAEPPDWRSWLDPARTPLALQEPDLPFRVKRIDELKAVFVQFRANQDARGHAIADFIDKARAEIRAAAPDHLILDMRTNGGGDYLTTADFMRELPRSIPPAGRVFVLTSPLTFSAGISSVAFLKAEGGDRVVVVGEPVGDRLVAYGEGGAMVLPNSRIAIHFATGLHDYRSGCRWFGPCFWLNWVHSAAVGSLDPDVAAPLDGPALAQGRDPALEAVAAAVH